MSEAAPPAPPAPPPSPEPTALYVHVPFCTGKCLYCDFATAPYQPAAVREYLDALALEKARRLPPGWRPRTVYFGGGTPGALAPDELARILALFADELGAAEEATLEANPETLDAAKAAQLVRAGVSRVSLGAESFDDARLAFLGRRHTAAAIERAVTLLREAGCASLSLDLLLAVPGSALADLERDLAAAARLAPEGLSLYTLSYERQTAFAVRLRRGELKPLDEAAEREQYLRAVELAESLGWKQYEVSNFARPGYACRHNLVYWRNEPYYGLGSAAVSYVGGRRFGNEERPTRYVARLHKEGTAESSSEQLDPAARARETLVLGLRLVEGLDEADFRRRTGVTLDAAGSAALAALVARGLVVREGGRLRLARAAFPVADAVAEELV